MSLSLNSRHLAFLIVYAEEECTIRRRKMFQMMNDLYFMFCINSLYSEKILSHILEKYDDLFLRKIIEFRFEASCEVGIVRIKIRFVPQRLE